MYLSSWQLAKFMVWLEHKLMAAIPEVMLCDFFFCFQNRRGYRFFFPSRCFSIRFACSTIFSASNAPNAKSGSRAEKSPP